MSNPRIAVVIDDHPITHLGCRKLLASAGYEVIVEASDGPTALRQIERTPPALAVVDIGLPGVGGLQLVRPILQRAPQCRILVFSMNDSPAFAAQALDVGAHGYLSKHAPPEDFLAAVRTLEDGRIYLARQVAIDVATLARREANPLASLTPREHQVLRLIGAGLRHDEIASEINVSYKTVANTTAALKRKLSARSLPDLMRIAVLNEGNAAGETRA